jgi:hypothetical protein
MRAHYLPAAVYHADWGSDSRKRWFSKAVLTDDGYRAYSPALVEDHIGFISRLRRETGTGGVILGFDFPIGIPERYAARVAITAFKPFLLQLGAGAFADFYRLAETAADISLHRPFYPLRPGCTRHDHLVSGLGLACIDDLRRRCERPYNGRRAACPLFWTLGANQVSKAAIIGWRDVLIPALHDPTLKLWPFDGPLDRLMKPGNLVVAETYPAECYGWFFAQPVVKTSLDSRRNVGSVLSARAQSAHVALDPALRQIVEAGFPQGDDAFDAVVGLFGILEVLLSRRTSCEPSDESVRQLEGWILGQRVL